MPKLDPSFDIALWNISETEETLYSDIVLSPEAKKRLSSRKSETHRKAYLSIRQLLKQLKIEPQTHQYDDFGAPYLTDNRFLSISHTTTFAAVAVSSQAVGIDIETYKEKILRIAPRFLHTTEVELQTAENPVKQLTKIWTAKEAIYKALRTPGIHFSKQIIIDPFSDRDQHGSATVYLEAEQKKFNLYYFYFQNHCGTIATIKNTN